MKYIFLIYFLLVGCAGKVVNDPVLPAIEANYPTAEFRACGLHWLGSSICQAPVGTKYSDIDLQVQVYYKGTLSVVSKDCQLDTHLTYDGTQLIPITIPGTVEQDCLISITVSPVYPNNENNPTRVYSFRGYLALKKSESKRVWHGFTRKVTGDFSSPLKIWVGGTKAANLVASGCGRKNPVDREIELINGYLIFDIADIVPGGMLPKTCVIAGFIRSEYPDIVFNVLVSKYDPRFVPLPIPDVKIVKNRVKIVADSSVSIVGLNENYDIDNQSRFPFNPQVKNIIRILTTSARSVLGVWNVPTQSWEWKQ